MSGAGWLAACAALEAPTRAQIEAFAVHVCQAHSWYKHMPLMQGGELVVFIAPDAGAGFEGELRRLHYSWKTTAEYRERFGYLDYCWRYPGGVSWHRDSVAEELYPAHLPDAVRRAGWARLMPYGSPEFWSVDAIGFGLHDEAAAALRAGAAHEDGPLLHEALRLYDAGREPEPEAFEECELVERLERLSWAATRRLGAGAVSWAMLLSDEEAAGVAVSERVRGIVAARDGLAVLERRLYEGQVAGVERAVWGMLDAARCLGLWG
jgi:hypothetical protein